MPNLTFENTGNSIKWSYADGILFEKTAVPVVSGDWPIIKARVIHELIKQFNLNYIEALEAWFNRSDENA